MASIDFDVDDYLDEASTEELLKELHKREVDCLMAENPLTILGDLQTAFDRNDAHEFCFLKEKLRGFMEKRHA